MNASITIVKDLNQKIKFLWTYLFPEMTRFNREGKETFVFKPTGVFANFSFFEFFLSKIGALCTTWVTMKDDVEKPDLNRL
jgi:hypothetical protein